MRVVALPVSTFYLFIMDDVVKKGNPVDFDSGRTSFDAIYQKRIFKECIEVSLRTICASCDSQINVFCIKHKVYFIVNKNSQTESIESILNTALWNVIIIIPCNSCTYITMYRSKWAAY